MVRNSVVAERYFQLTLLGREAFVKSVAAAALVRQLAPKSVTGSSSSERGDREHNIGNSYSEDTLLARLDGSMRGGPNSTGEIEIYPLDKKSGAPFADMITVGRTANNDVVLRDITVSRFHAFFRERDGSWLVCDAGSKNGTFLGGTRLTARQEVILNSGDAVKLGDIATTFYTAEDLYDVLRSAE